MGWLLLQKSWQIPGSKYNKFGKGKAGSAAPLWHHHNKNWLMPLMALGVPTIIGVILGDWLAGLLVIGFARLLLQYHCTWVVNSVGHTWGETTDNFATNFAMQFAVLPVMATVTVGEAWHAYHHDTSADWKLGRNWWHFDPGAYVLMALSWVGVTELPPRPNKRKRVPQAR
jgi:Fatty-acid desaturase